MNAVIQSLGPYGVFALMAPERACIPVPNEATLLFSGFAVSQHLMSFWLAVLAATAGNVVGSVIAYGFGGSRWLGRIPGAQAIVERYGRLLGKHWRSCSPAICPERHGRPSARRRGVTLAAAAGILALCALRLLRRHRRSGRLSLRRR